MQMMPQGATFIFRHMGHDIAFPQRRDKTRLLILLVRSQRAPPTVRPLIQ